MIESLLEYLASNPPGHWTGPVMGVIAFSETLFPPIPGDVLFIVISGWAISGGLPVASAALWGVTGCIAASCLLFYLGHRPGRQFVEGWLTRKVQEPRITRARKLVKKHGPLILAGSRFIPGIRSLLVLIAGTSGMRFALALGPIALSATAWYVILAFAGSVLGSNMESAEGFMKQFEIWIWLVLGAAVICFAGFRILRRKRT